MLISTLLRSWRQNWQQLLFVLLGMLSGIAGLTAVLVINETAKQKINGLNNTIINDVYAIARLKDGAVFSKAEYAKLRRSGLEAIASAHFTRAINGNEVNFLAVDTAAMLSANSFIKTNSKSTPPVLEQNSTDTNVNLYMPLTSKAYIEQTLSSIPQELFAPYPFPSPSKMVRENLVYLSLSLASTLSTPIDINQLWIVEKPNRQQLSILHEAGFKLQFIDYQQSNITSSFHINIFAMGGLMLAVSLFVVLNAYNLLLSGRTLFLKQLYVLGISIKHLRNLFIIEAFCLWLICITLGFYLGELLAQILAPGVKQTLEGLYDVQFSDQQVGIAFLKAQIALVTLSALSIVILFPLNSSLKNLSSDVSSSYESYASTPYWCLAMACMLLFITLIEFYFHASLMLSFVSIVLVVLLGCLASIKFLPMLVTTIKSLMPEQHPIMYYFASDAVRLSQRNSIAFCAFFIAITANIGMNVMVDSFRQATESWIDKQFTADLYLSTKTPEYLRTWQSKQSNLLIYERKKALIRINGQETELIARPDSGIKALNLQFKELSAIHNQTQIDGVYINEQLSLKQSLKPGSFLVIEGNTYAIRGVYYDYGNMHNQVIVEPSIVEQLQQQTSEWHLFSVSKTGNTKAIERELTEFKDYLKDKNVSFYSGENIRTISVNVFDQTFTITSVLNIVTLLVAGISLATSIIIVDRQNQRHYNTLRQLGVKRFHIQGANFVQYFYICTLLFICAIPIGLLLSWMLIYKINLMSFFWTYPMMINISPISAVYLLAVLSIALCLLFSIAVNNPEKNSLKRV